MDISNSYVEISHNRMTAKGAAGTGVFAVQGWVAGWGLGAPLPPLPAPRYVITDNDMRSRTALQGCSWSTSPTTFGAAGRLKAVIADNTIVLGDGVPRHRRVLYEEHQGPAQLPLELSDARLRASTWEMAAPTAPPLPVSGWKIIGNDLRDLTASEAPIVLGEGTTHCVVVCPWRTDVLDKGVDNILVNANRL